MRARRSAVASALVAATLPVCLAAQVTTAEDAARLRIQAEQGDANAQNSLGFLYHRGGAGIKRDFSQAIHWYSLAAQQGLGAAKNNLCTLHAASLNVYQGVRPAPGQALGPIEPATGTKTDAEGILKWCPEAADHGFAISQRALGLFHAKGAKDSTGVPLAPQNFAEAYFWLLQVAKDSFRDAVAAHLTAEKRAEVERKAVAWKPTRQHLP